MRIIRAMCAGLAMLTATSSATADDTAVNWQPITCAPPNNAVTIAFSSSPCEIIMTGTAPVAGRGTVLTDDPRFGRRRLTDDDQETVYGTVRFESDWVNIPRRAVAYFSLTLPGAQQQCNWLIKQEPGPQQYAVSVPLPPGGDITNAESQVTLESLTPGECVNPAQPGYQLTIRNVRFYESWDDQTNSSCPANACTNDLCQDDFGAIVQMLCWPQGCTGDVNGDCQVDFDDFLIISSNWGSSDCRGDANLDGSVDFLDIQEWLASYNMICNCSKPPQRCAGAGQQGCP